MAGVEDDDGSDEDHGRTVGAVLVDGTGSLLVSVTATDGESFWTFLESIEDIAADLPPGATAHEGYAGNFWITAMDRAADGKLWLADAEGRVHTNAGGAWRIEPVTPGNGLRAIRCLRDGTVAAGGTAGEVWSRTADGWQRLGTALETWINGIDGRGADDLWVAGDAGLVARYDGQEWTRIDLATNAVLNAVLALESEVICCGAGGALYRGSGEAWDDLTSPVGDLFGLASYRGEIWIACGTAGAGRLTPHGVEVERDTFAAYAIHSNGNFVAFAGHDLVVRHDGNDWEALSYDDDDDDDDNG